MIIGVARVNVNLGAGGGIEPIRRVGSSVIYRNELKRESYTKEDWNMGPERRRDLRSFLEEPGDMIRREVTRMFGGTWLDTDEAGVGAYPVDIREDDENLYVDAELPGFRKEDVQVTLEKDRLKIRAERTADEFAGTRHLEERRFYRVDRRFTLPVDIDETQVEARFENGLLRLKLQKTAETQPRKIDIS